MKKWIANNKTFFLILCLVALTILSLLAYFSFYHPDIQMPVLNTYFNQDYKYSLEIPADWVGRYAPQEIKKGDTAFIYLGDGKTTFPIFIISVIPESQWQGERNVPGSPKLIIRKDGNAFTYRISPDNPYEKIGKNYYDEFAKFVSQVPDVVKTMSFQ